MTRGILEVSAGVPEIHGSDMRGMSRLAFDGIAGLIGMVETMHGNIARHPGLAPGAEGKTRGVTRLVYRSIRGVTHLTGAEVDAAPRQAIPLPEGVHSFAIAASTGNRAGGLRDRLLGDGLVPVHSALGEHKDPRRSLAIPVPHQWVGRTMSHFGLLSRQDVYEQIRLWATL